MNKSTILVVDDEAIIAKNLQRTLNKLGFHVPDIAYSGKEAVKKATDIHPDIVLMDINMPGEIDGIDAANLIRQQLDIPIIFVTAHADEDILARARVSEPFGYILKPVTIRELQSNIEMALYKHRMEKELKVNRAYWQALTENASDIVLLVNKDGKITYGSPSIQRLVGYQPAELMNMNVVERIHADDISSLSQIIPKIFESSQKVHKFMFRFKHKDNHWTNLEGLIRNKLQSPDIGGFVLNIRDVTERVQMETALLQSNQELETTLVNLKATQEQLIERERLAAIGHLAGGMAHEFNNIMAAVLLQADLLLNKATLPNDLQHRVKTIHESGERAAGLVQQILDFSRKAMIQTESVELNRFLQDFESLLPHLLNEAIKFDFVQASGPLFVRIDASRLKQALLNLVLNSQNALPNGGTLQIKLTQHECTTEDPIPIKEMEPGRWVRILVRDNGTGIAPEILPRVFEPFFSTRSPLNSGLGLSQTLGIVQQHDGHMKIESVVGEGTAVSIYLPLLPMTASNPEKTSKQTDSVSGRVLLLETNEHLRYALADGLMALGYDLLIAENAEQATMLMEQFERQILCLICDQSNKGSPSEQFSQEMLITYPHVRVILLADYVSLDDAVDELGILWLRKPVSLDVLENALQRIM